MLGGSPGGVLGIAIPGLTMLLVLAYYMFSLPVFLAILAVTLLAIILPQIYMRKEIERMSKNSHRNE